MIEQSIYEREKMTTNTITTTREEAIHEAIIEILAAAKKIIPNRGLAANIFESAGIILDDHMSFVSLADDAETCVKALMSNLSLQPVLRLTAKYYLRSRGLICVPSVRWIPLIHINPPNRLNDFN